MEQVVPALVQIRGWYEQRIAGYKRSRATTRHEPQHEPAKSGRRWSLSRNSSPVLDWAEVFRLLK